MSCRTMCALLLGITSAVGVFGAPARHHHNANTVNSNAFRHAPAFRIGYLDGYRQGANDSAALSNAYRDQSGSLYDQALDGYAPQYGDQATYQKLYRQGYVEGYKAGWDFNSGQYSPLGAGGGGPGE